ncbi:putative dehydrogenase [Murinocardiopsis flavida]|uniref:Putative dehydrogenase n=1 Tax=Murinocardiopsis flavida TaxID=645275 RepID=A0A2P8DKR4_9ACTN|nr:Gfo/Idh/MocA family oxidoreductase [Murinocardiopsis flavida]PSK97789.1 putative dehydrogenase [Murinocardiopsis flavida]
MGDTRVRVGVIGLGLIAQAVHLHTLRVLRDRFELVHVCDLSPGLAGQVAAEWGEHVRHSTDAEAVFADDRVDAVLLLTPDAHTDLAHRALARGKHVFAEKPFSFSAEGAEQAQRDADARSLVLQVGYMKMYDPIVRRAREEIAAIGTPRLVRVTVLHPADDPQFGHVRLLRHNDVDPAALDAARAAGLADLDAGIGDVAEPWRSLYSDVLHGSVVHELSVLRALFDEARPHFDHAQVGAGTVTPGAPLSEPPQLQALGRLGTAQLALSWNWLPDHPDYGEEIAVFGSAGSVRLDYPGPYLLDHRATLTVERADGAERMSAALRSDHRTGFVHELIELHAAITEGAPVRSTAAGAARDSTALRDLADALVRSGG